MTTPNPPLRKAVGFELAALLCASFAAMALALWRRGLGAWGLVASLVAGSLALLCLWRLHRLRQPLPRLETKRRTDAQVFAATLPDALLASLVALLWCAPALLPRSLVQSAALLLPCEAVITLLGCVIAQVRMARLRRIGDQLAFALVALVLGLVTARLATPENPAPWFILGVFVLARGWQLRTPRPWLLPEIERWLLALGVLVTSYWCALLLASLLPLPRPGVFAPAPRVWLLPEPLTLLWALLHFTILACLRWRDWPSVRAEEVPPAFGKVAAGTGRRERVNRSV